MRERFRFEREALDLGIETVQEAFFHVPVDELPSKDPQACPDDFKNLSKICKGSLGQTTKKKNIDYFYFPGTSDKKALVIGGVHGSELSGIEVVRLLVDSLKTGPKPHFHVIVVPELFPDNAERARNEKNTPGADSNIGRYTDSKNCTKMVVKGKKECVDPNRQFPKPGESITKRAGKFVDAEKRPIEPENVKLIELINSFKPIRIASVHAHSLSKSLKKNKDAQGIFADPHTFPKSASTEKKKIAKARTEADCFLAFNMARRFREKYNKATGTEKGAERIPGNWLGSESPTCSYGEASTQPGISLGGWGPRAIDKVRNSITVITVEVRHYYPSNEKQKPVARGKNYEPENVDGVKNRLEELKAHRDALREVFLGPPLL